MADKKLILVIVAEQGYFHRLSDRNSFPIENDILFSAISDTYLPLLNMLSSLESENIPVKLSIVLSSSITTLLSDPQIQQQYIDFLDRRIALGNEEIERNKDDPEILGQVKYCLTKYMKDKLDFTEVFSQDLVAKFKYFASKDILEIIPTAATYAYLPHYSDMTEILNAQVETGIRTNRRHFDDAGEGFFLPYMGWESNLDKILRSYGVNYTILDAKSVLFSKTIPDRGVFAPCRTQNSLVVFARDNESTNEINGEQGFIRNEAYRSQLKDIGYELENSRLETFLGNTSARIQTGYKYWANDGEEEDESEDSNSVYNIEAAKKQAQLDAEAFYKTKCEKLAKAKAYLEDEDPLLLCTIPAELLGQSWHEGMMWLENLIRLVAAEGVLELSHCSEHLEEQYSLPKISPYPCASEGFGYAENLLDNQNSWMLRYVRKASERMVDIAERFPSETGLKERLLNLGAREVLLAQSSDWPRMVQDGLLPDYAVEEFKKNILSFTTVFDSLASNTVSTEWLTGLEKEHAIFPWINYRIFSRKK